MRTNYSGKFEDSWWETWPKNDLTWKIEPWIKHEKINDIAQSVNFEEHSELSWLTDILQNGADTGVRGSARLPCPAKNIKSAETFGREVSDALAEWVRLKLVAGPLLESELPPQSKVSPISCQIKPNSRARILVDMSSPHRQNVDLNSDIPSSVNSGIDKSKFPVSMITTGDILEMFLHAGDKSFISKQDWNDAYKHIPVRLEDLCLQVISFGGRYFIDKNLPFGTSSSPGNCWYL